VIYKGGHLKQQVRSLLQACNGTDVINSTSHYALYHPKYLQASIDYIVAQLPPGHRQCAVVSLQYCLQE